MSIRLSEIATAFNDVRLVGSDTEVKAFASLQHCTEDHLVWVKNKSFLPLHSITAAVITEDEAVVDALRDTNSVLLCAKRSRYYVALIHTTYFDKPINYTENYADQWREHGIHVGDYTYIAKHVQIGEGSVIGPNVTITDDVVIGANCDIQPNTVLGAKGLGLEWDGDRYLGFPQLGRVVLGEGCVIGPLSTIRKGALADTMVGAFSQIGSLCNIGHNVQLGEASLLTSSICISGSAQIGKRCFLGVGATIKNKVKLGNNITVGQGCVVVKDVLDDGATVVGNPARILKKDS